MSKKRKSKTNTIASLKSFEDLKLPYLAFSVKEVGNLPNAAPGKTHYTLHLSTTLEGLQFQAINNKPLYPCCEKVTHKTDWEWHLKLPSLKGVCDFVNLSAEFIVAQLFEEIEPSANPSEPADIISAHLTELGNMVISTNNLLVNGGNITKTQIFYGEEVIPLKTTWTNSPFIKYNMSLMDCSIPTSFIDLISFEVTFDSILNIPVDPKEYDIHLKLSLPCNDIDSTFVQLQFSTTAEKFVYKSFSKLRNYPENIKYTNFMVETNKSLKDFDLPSDMFLRDNIEDNGIIPQNTCQKIVIPTFILKDLCNQEEIIMELALTPNIITKTSKKNTLVGKFNLKAFLENEITNHKVIVPFIEQILDEEGFNACVLLDFQLSSLITNEPFIDPQIEIDAAKFTSEKAICESNISKYLKMKSWDFIQNYQKHSKLKYLRQTANLTNLKVFDNYYLYSEKHFLTAAVNYLSVNRAKYGNFRDVEVKKKCLIDLCDFTNDVIFKLDERSPLPDPCAKELFELGFYEEANGIHIMQIVKTNSKETKPFIAYAIYNLLILDPVKSNECCNRALELEPDLPIAKLIQSYMHFIFHEYTEAEEILVNLTKKEPNFTEAWYALYIIFYQLSKLQELSFVEEGLYLASENPLSAYQDDPVLWSPRKTNDPKINCIQTFVQWGCIGYAELALSFVLTKYGFDSFEYSYHMAIVNYYKGDYQLAIKRLLFFGSDWQQRIAIKLKVHCLLKIHNSKALEYIREIPRCHDRNNNLIYLKVSQFYLDLKKFKTARFYAKKCCLKFQSYSAFKLLAMASYKCKDCAVTEMCCKVLYEMNPHNIYSFCALGGLYAREDLAPQRIYCGQQCNYLKEQQDSLELQYIKNELLVLFSK